MKRNNNFGKLLYFFKKTHDEFEKEINNRAKKLNLTKQEAEILLILSTQKYKYNCELVKGRGYSKSYFSKGVKSLIEKKLISFKKDENDKRFQHIIINESAAKEINELKNMQKERYANLKKGITEDELSQFYLIVDKMLKNMKEDN